MLLRRLSIFQSELVDRKILERRTEMWIDARGVLELTVRGNQIALSGQSDAQQIAGLKVLRLGVEKLLKESDSLIPLALADHGFGLGVGLRRRGRHNGRGHQQQTRHQIQERIWNKHS